MSPKQKVSMMQKLGRRYCGVLLVSAFLFSVRGTSQNTQNSSSSPLQVSFGENGLQTLRYDGTTLANLGANPGDAFYIGHMKATDLGGRTLSGGQYGWGETNSGKHWNASTQTWNYTFSWGAIAVQYLQNGANLDVLTTVTNNRDSGIIFDGAAVFPLVLRFPQLPNGFVSPSYPQLAFNTTGPSVTTADWGDGEVVAVAPDARKPLYTGFWPAQGSGGVAYNPQISGTTPDGLATFQPHNDRPVYPGQTDRYTVSLRFAPRGTPTYPLAADAYANWASVYPSTLDWTDRRAIGTVYLASSPQGGDPSHSGGFPTNPRRYFNSSAVDVTTAAGLAAFQQQVLKQAASVVANAEHLNAQGVITWDIEGEQYPQATSYVCEPDEIAQVAPEMEKTVSIPGSPYNGKKLDDAYFSILKSAGLRVGVCVRPQHFTLNADGTASQAYLAPQAILAELTRKARYAHDRWGATLFYVDSTVDNIGSVLPAAIFAQLHTALPDSLFIPEETDPLHYAYTAPFKSFIDLGAVGTEAGVLSYYPHAFSAVLVNDADPGKLAAAQTQLVKQVGQGDILMAHVDYWQANNPTVMAIYQAAGVTAPTTAPVTTPPPAPPAPAPVPTPAPAPEPTPAPTSPPTASSLISIAGPITGELVSGAIVIQGIVNDALDAAGSHLVVDGFNLLNTRLTGGPYTYPLDTRTLPNGTHVLQLWGHDIANNTILSGTVTIVVHN